MYGDISTSKNLSRAKRLVKHLKKIIAQEHLYSDEQLKDLKNQLRVIEEELTINDDKLKKGFWNYRDKLKSLSNKK